jgi:hypothetical protein
MPKKKIHLKTGKPDQAFFAPTKALGLLNEHLEQHHTIPACYRMGERPVLPYIEFVKNYF